MSSDSAIGEILESISPEDFLADLGVDFRVTSGRSGTQLNIKTCPRCGGNKWKVFLNSETGLGNCFSGACAGEGGFNLFTFTQQQIGADGKETFERFKSFAKTTGWRPKRKATVFERPDIDVKIPLSIPLRQGNALPYLEKRGFSGEWQDYFEWRFCAFAHYQYTDASGEARYQDYSNRVLIPVRDIDGNVATFQGRDITGTHEKKYLFPPQLPGTGMFLYAAHLAKGAHTLVINEGVMDMAATTIAIRKEGLSGFAAVASFGLTLSGDPHRVGNDQYGALMTLKQHGLKNLVFMWDSEKAALLAACKEAVRVAKLGFKVSIAILPFGKDPNEVAPEIVTARLRSAAQATPINLAKIKMKAMSLPA